MSSLRRGLCKLLSVAREISRLNDPESSAKEIFDFHYDGYGVHRNQINHPPVCRPWQARPTTPGPHGI